MQALLKLLSPVSSLPSLCTFIDSIDLHIRALLSLGVFQDSYGVLYWLQSSLVNYQPGQGEIWHKTTHLLNGLWWPQSCHVERNQNSETEFYNTDHLTYGASNPRSIIVTASFYTGVKWCSLLFPAFPFIPVVRKECLVYTAMGPIPLLSVVLLQTIRNAQMLWRMQSITICF